MSGFQNVRVTAIAIATIVMMPWLVPLARGRVACAAILMVLQMTIIAWPLSILYAARGSRPRSGENHK